MRKLYYIAIPFLLLVILFILIKKKIINFGDDYFNPHNSSGASITDDEAKNIADALHVAMGSIGTDFETIKTVLEGLSSSDYAKVYNQFGTRGYLDFIGVGTDVWGALSLNLNQWFYSELSDSQVKEMRPLFSWFA